MIKVTGTINKEIMFDHKYCVVKWDDIRKALTTNEVDELKGLLDKVGVYRSNAGKTVHNSYLVVNTNEAYAGEVAEIMLRHGHCSQYTYWQMKRDALKSFEAEIPSNEAEENQCYIVSSRKIAFCENCGKLVFENGCNCGGAVHRFEAPDVCPMTKRQFFMWIYHPDLGWEPTYGGPYDSYTIPQPYEDGDGYHRERYDHDRGCWIDGGEFFNSDDEEQD